LPLSYAGTRLVQLLATILTSNLANMLRRE
ncbi:unnamed protein product, partial [marine sediment metagenome]